MKRKTLAILTAAAMAAGSLSACVCVYAADDATHIYVLTAPEDHGWTGSVQLRERESGRSKQRRQIYRRTDHICKCRQSRLLISKIS